MSEQQQIDLALEGEAFEDACEAYLDGRLDAAATRRFERALLEPARAERFREALLLRELFAGLGPEAPADLADRLAALVAASRGAGGRSRGEAGVEADPAGWRAALSALAWTVRGPGLAFTTASSAPSGAGLALQGLGTVRFAAGSLAVTPAERPARRRPLWRRLLARRSHA